MAWDFSRRCKMFQYCQCKQQSFRFTITSTPCWLPQSRRLPPAALIILNYHACLFWYGSSAQQLMARRFIAFFDNLLSANWAWHVWDYESSTWHQAAEQNHSLMKGWQLCVLLWNVSGPKIFLITRRSQ